MRYYKAIIDGYVNSVNTVERDGNGNITEAEYNHILSVVQNAPTAPEGYGYRLKENLEWELYELPIVEDEPHGYTEAELTEMTNAQLTQILSDMGISATMNKANMVRLILSMQEVEP